MPARAASSPAGRASPPDSDRHMAAREGSARRFATNAMLGSVMGPSLARQARGCFTTRRRQISARGRHLFAVLLPDRMPGEVLDGRGHAAERAGRIPPELDLPEAHAERVVGQ